MLLKLSRFVLLSLLVLTGCTPQEENSVVHSKPVKLTDYMYEITFTDYSMQNLVDYATTIDNYAHGGACTAVKYGNIACRNYDYLYGDVAEFVVHVPAAPGRYASIGVAGSLFELTSENAEHNFDGIFSDVLPYLTVDGMNEKGVFCSINMVDGEDHYSTTGTNPSSDVTLWASSVVRYVLDNCSSAAQACEVLKSCNIIGSEIYGENHYMIADKNDTYIVEVMDNKLVCRKPKENFMTNFYVLTDKFLEHDDAGSYASGLERYQYVRQHYSELSTREDATPLLKGLRYSQLYDFSTSPYWYSEFCGYYYNGFFIDVNTPTEDYEDFVKAQIDRFQHKTRDYTQGLWITTHSSIYDLENLTLRVHVQENFDKAFDFQL